MHHTFSQRSVDVMSEAETMVSVAIQEFAADSDVYIYCFWSCDWLEDLEGKTSIGLLLHKRVNFVSVSHPQIFRSPLKKKGISELNASFGHLQSIINTAAIFQS